MLGYDRREDAAIDWIVRLSADADLEIRCFLADLGPRGHAAAKDLLRQLRDELPGGASLVSDSEHVEMAPLRDLAIARFRLADAAFGNQAMAVLAAFAVRTRVMGILGCAVWPESDNWQTLPVNGIAGNPTWFEYLAGPVNNMLRFRAGGVRIVRSVRERYARFRVKFGD